MKTAHEWIDDGRGSGMSGYEWREINVTELKAVQLDAMNAGVQVAIDYMVGHYWGHEIIRAAVYHLCATNGLPMPKVPFAPERLHPGATRAEVPPKAAEVPLPVKDPPAPVRPLPERVAGAHLREEDWPASFRAAQLSSPPNPKTSNPPPSQEPSPPHPAGECPPCADPPGPVEESAQHLSSPSPDQPDALRSSQPEPCELEAWRSVRLDLEKLVTDVCERFEAAERRIARLEALPLAGPVLGPLRQDVDRLLVGIDALEKFQQKMQRVHEALAKQNASLIEALSHPTAVAATGEVVGLSRGQEVDEVRFLTVKWQGDHWLLLKLQVAP